MPAPTPPTPEDFAAHARVMDHFAYMEKLMCKHDESLTCSDPFVGPVCSKCGEPMLMYSQIQIDNITKLKGGDPDGKTERAH